MAQLGGCFAVKVFWTFRSRPRQNVIAEKGDSPVVRFLAEVALRWHSGQNSSMRVVRAKRSDADDRR